MENGASLCTSVVSLFIVAFNENCDLITVPRFRLHIQILRSYKESQCTSRQNYNAGFICSLSPVFRVDNLEADYVESKLS